MPEPRAAYVHVPFCRHHCGYCNFTVTAGRDDLIAEYLRALARELAWLERPRDVDTLFIGGGTPTHLSPAQLAQLLETVRQWFPLAPGGEFSIEANPADVDADGVQILADHGVTRVSLGAQSFDADKLRLLERDHLAADIRRAVERAQAGGCHVALDLIFGTPGESLAAWRRDLRWALELEPRHVSTYGLTYERGTTFWGRLSRGDLKALDEDAERDMYTATIDTLIQAGYEHYEVSNFARPGHQCRHNEAYWAGGSYFAAGPGAARYVDGRREMNHRSTTTWMRRVLAGESPVAEAETLGPEDRAREALVLGLRRIAGVAREEFAGRTGYSIDALCGAALGQFVDRGLLADDGHSVRLTRDGLLVSDALWPKILRA